MAAELLRALIMTTLASSAAVLLVGLLRRPIRRLAGARAAYCLWLLVPALTLAVLIPPPSQILLPPTAALPAQLQTMLDVAVADPASNRSPWIALTLALWLSGALVMCAFMLARQRAFMRVLGQAVHDARGFFRADVAVPMLVGILRPRIVVPADFESRYPPEEQEVVLAHESAHADRGDVAMNALACGALCLFWFNPLVYRAIAWLRVDQELACDALVLSSRPHARRTYASALLATQIAADAAWRMPIACQWGWHGQSNHPLKERILMLKRPLPGFTRRMAGIALALGIAAASGYGAWAGQTGAGDGPPILVDLKVTVTNAQTSETHVLATRYLVHSGEEIRDANSQPLQYACTPYLPDEPGRSTDWTAIKARGIPLPPAGHILVLCSIREDGQEVAAPAVLMADGKPGVIEIGRKEGSVHYRLDVDVSTSAARIAAAAEQAQVVRP
ncbi:MAG TPA: M56 family metallopeptidase [Steroidobacteraceae bacterium]